MSFPYTVFVFFGVCDDRIATWLRGLFRKLFNYASNIFIVLYSFKLRRKYKGLLSEACVCIYVSLYLCVCVTVSTDNRM